MGTGLLTPPARRELRTLAAATGFRPDMIEKTVRLLALADRIAAHPYLGRRLALTGGTALNMFVLDVPRQSFDLDYNDAGGGRTCGIRTDRTITCWGARSSRGVPSGEFAAVSPGRGLRGGWSDP